MRFLDKHFAREKQLRRLEREAQRLWQAQGAAPIIPLERPYQRGWVKTYVLEDRIERRPDAELFRALLREVNKRVYSRERSFVNRGGHPIVLRPQVIHVREWQKLAWPASHQRFFAFGTWRVEDVKFWLPPHRAWTCGYKLISMWWLREDIQPHLITHQRVDLPDVKSRLAEIEQHMRLTQGWRRLDRLHGRRQWRWDFTAPLEVLRSTDSFSDQSNGFSPD
ncbi:MAG: hypothetical protein NTV51_06190 [Verrucomicrobia bacterium]|nr:hypothetical protein [Verrucomicrobiota bacterium]